jgi:two-component system sensor histidine kinase KdpD
VTSRVDHLNDSQSRTGWRRHVAEPSVWVTWLAILAGVTLVLLSIRERLDNIHVALAFLLVVLGGSARGGRALGLTLAVVAFLAFNFVFLPPFYTLQIANPFDWLVLFAFLLTSAIAAQLLSRAQSEATEARRRAEEIDRLAILGAETLNAGRAEDGLTAVATVIRTTLGVDRCEIYLRDAGAEGVVRFIAASTGQAPEAPRGFRLIEWVASSGQVATEGVDGTMQIAAGDDRRPAEPGAVPGSRALLLPLIVRDRTVGVLRIASRTVLALDPAQRRVLDALGYYAALGAERVRLAAEAEHAESLREVNRLKDALIASVSHDLRTPLTTIKGLAEEIRRGGDDRAAIIEEEADRLNRFVADLLDLSRLTGGGIVVTPEINAVDDLIGAALQRISGMTSDRRIDVWIDPEDPVLLGRFDFVHALRIIVNLLENAMKYSPPDAAIGVHARRAGGMLEIVVADRGPGVPDSERERIFTPFYRAPRAAADQGGTGLGLSIARGLAEAQGGTLEYEPNNGHGSRFVLRLPAAAFDGTADGAHPL